VKPRNEVNVEHLIVRRRRCLLFTRKAVAQLTALLPDGAKPYLLCKRCVGKRGVATLVAEKLRKPKK
jgi:hypothetical protein